MIIVGILLLIGGAGLAIYGNNLNNSFEAQWDALWNNGTTDPGSSYIIIGIIIAVIGLILLLYALLKSDNEENTKGTTIIVQPNTNLSTKQDDTYVKVDGYYQCRICGNKQILTNGGKCLNCNEELAKY